MVVPILLARIEQRLKCLSNWIDPCDVGTFVPVAGGACEGHVCFRRFSIMLPGNNMVGAKSLFDMRFWEPAVFAQSARSRSDLLLQRRGHESRRSVVRLQGKSCLCMQNAEDIADQQIILKFAIFFRS